MPLVNFQSRNSIPAPGRKQLVIPKPIRGTVSIFAVALLGVGTMPACAASFSRSVDVEGAPAAVWSMIGPFCAVKDWLPPVGTCTEDGRAPPTRTLVTRDGKATFVEMQTARSDTRHFYSYTFVSSPLPVTHYTSTLEVEAKGNGASTVTWRATYVPDPGKEKDAKDALAGIYGAGLGAIKARLAKQARETTDTRLTTR
jgi:hypothetical protein